MPLRPAGALSIVLAALGAGPARAAAWPQARGHGQVILKLSTYRSDRQFDEAGHVTTYANQGTSSQQEANLYLEYGLTDQLTLVGDFYVDLPAYQDAYHSYQTVSLGTEQVALRYGLTPGDAPIVWAVQGLVKFPADPGNTSLVAGERQVDLEARVLAGHSWSLPGFDPFVDLEGAYRYRFGNPPSQVRFDGTLGTHFLGRWMAIADAEAITSLPGGHPYAVAGLPQLRDPSFDLYKVEGSLVYQLKPGWHLQLGLSDYAAGRNTGAGLVVFAASWWSW